MKKCGLLGHMAPRGWARLLLDRARDLIIHGRANSPLAASVTAV